MEISLSSIADRSTIELRNTFSEILLLSYTKFSLTVVSSGLSDACDKSEQLIHRLRLISLNIGRQRRISIIRLTCYKIFFYNCNRMARIRRYGKQRVAYSLCFSRTFFNYITTFSAARVQKHLLYHIEI